MPWIVAFLVFFSTDFVLAQTPWQVDDQFVPFPLLCHTILLFLAVSALAVPAGTLIAFLLFRTDLRFATAIRSVVLTIVLLPAFMHVAAWDAGFGLQGWVSRVVGPGVILLDGWPGAIWVHTVYVLPWVILMIGIFMIRVPGALEECAALDGPMSQVVWRVTLRHSMPGIFGSLIWILIVVANEVTITDVYQIRTYAEEVYLGFALGDTLQEAQTRTLPGALLIAATCFSAIRLAGSLVRSSELKSQDRRLTFRLGIVRYGAYVTLGLAVFVIVIIPIMNLCWKAGVTVVQTDEGRIRSWSFLKLLTLTSTSPMRYGSELAWSILLGQLASISAVVSSFWLVWNRHRIWARVLGVGVALLGVSVPGPILALFLVGLFNPIDIDWVNYLSDRTVAGAWIVLWLRTFPFAYLICLIATRTIQGRLLENARVDGASRSAQLRHVVIPILLPQIIAAWLICLVIAMGEVSGTILILPPGVMTLSIRIFNLVHYGVEDQLAALCLFQLLVFLPLVFLGTRLGLTFRK